MLGISTHQIPIFSIEEASTEEVEEIPQRRLLRGGVVAGLGVALIVLSVAGAGLTGCSAHISSTETESIDGYKEGAKRVYSNSKHLADFQSYISIAKCQEMCDDWKNKCEDLNESELSYTREESCDHDCSGFIMQRDGHCTLFADGVELHDGGRGTYYTAPGTNVPEVTRQALTINHGNKHTSIVNDLGPNKVRDTLFAITMHYAHDYEPDEGDWEDLLKGLVEGVVTALVGAAGSDNYWPSFWDQLSANVAHMSSFPPHIYNLTGDDLWVPKPDRYHCPTCLAGAGAHTYHRCCMLSKLDWWYCCGRHWSYTHYMRRLSDTEVGWGVFYNPFDIDKDYSIHPATWQCVFYNEDMNANECQGNPRKKVEHAGRGEPNGVFYQYHFIHGEGIEKQIEVCTPKCTQRTYQWYTYEDYAGPCNCIKKSACGFKICEGYSLDESEAWTCTDTMGCAAVEDSKEFGKGDFFKFGSYR